ncbi:MAG: LpxD N-terminal domain-containing protein, partial [Terriglobales bacterium]
MKLSDIAQKLGARLDGQDAEITGVAGIEEAGPGQITFVANPKYAAAARTTKASAVIVAPDFPAIAAATLRCDNPYLAFARAIGLFHHPPRRPIGVHSTAVIHPSARVGIQASIGPYVVIEEDVQIGDHAVIHPHVVIYRGARIGSHFRAHAHA